MSNFLRIYIKMATYGNILVHKLAIEKNKVKNGYEVAHGCH